MPGKRLGALLWLALAAPALAAGQLEVRTEPPGAHVYLNNRHAGTSPVVIEAPAGAHRVTTQLRGHEPAAREVTIVDGLTRRTTLSLRALAAGELRLETHPSGAEVYLGGRRLGVTPLTARGLAPGNHALVVVRQGHQRLSRTVAIHDGLTTRLALGLTPLPQRAPAPREAAGAPRPAAVQPQAAPTAAPPRDAAPAATAPTVEARPQSPERPAEAAVAPQGPIGPVRPAGAIAPESTPAPATDPRTWVFTGLLALLAFGLAAYGRFAGRPEGGGVQWHPPAPARGPLPWSGPGAPEPAIRAMAQGRWEEARQAILASLAAGSGRDWHYFHLGLCCHHAGRWVEAEGAYRTALQLEAAHPAAGFDLGVMHAQLDQLPQAVMAYRRHLEEHPEDVEALFNLGCTYFSLGMLDQARTHWAAARSLAPGHRAVRENLRLLARLGRARRARKAS